MASMIC